MHLAHMACQSTRRHTRRYIPHEDRAVTSRRRELCIVMTPVRQRRIRQQLEAKKVQMTDTDMERTS